MWARPTLHWCKQTSAAKGEGETLDNEKKKRGKKEFVVIEYHSEDILAHTLFHRDRNVISVAHG